MKRITKSSALLIIFILSACNSDKDDLGGGPMKEFSCTEIFISGLNINVLDQETGVNSACDVTVTVQDGDYIEELSNNGACSESFIFTAAGERAGNYDITIAKEGYLEWTQFNTVVTENICHVNPVTVNAYMEKITVDVGDIGCPEIEPQPALNISIFDKITGAANACGVTVMIKDGDFNEELTNAAGENCIESFTFSAISQRSGSYDISVIKDGYVDWYSYDNEISANVCALNPISVAAYLER